MQIKKIKLKDGGFKGAEITFLRPEEKRNKTFINEVTEKRKNPIQFDLERPFKDLRYHMLLICGVINTSMEKMEIDYAIADCDVDGIKISDEFFVLFGTVKSQYGDKRFKLETPKMTDEDGYIYYEAVKVIIETIVEETTLYITGKKEVSNEEVVIRWIGAGKDKKITKDVFDEMSDADKKEYCKRILEEEFGCMVNDTDDFAFASDLEETEGAPVLELPAPTEFKEDEVIKFEVEDAVIVEDNDEIILDAEEIIIPAKKTK